MWEGLLFFPIFFIFSLDSLFLGWCLGERGRIMSANLIKEIWKAIEEIQSTTLLGLEDGELLTTVLGRVKNSQTLTMAESKDASSYINSRICLIRDLAISRLENDWDWDGICRVSTSIR